MNRSKSFSEQVSTGYHPEHSLNALERNLMTGSFTNSAPAGTNWQPVLEGHSLKREDARLILNSSDEEILDLLAATYRVLTSLFCNTVQLFFLMNAVGSPEDCVYCSQSKVSRRKFLDTTCLRQSYSKQLASLASVSLKHFVSLFCPRPVEREIDFVCSVVPQIKEQYSLNVCVPRLINTGPK